VDIKYDFTLLPTKDPAEDPNQDVVALDWRIKLYQFSISFLFSFQSVLKPAKDTNESNANQIIWINLFLFQCV
jgi:hypothetical protein